MEKKKVFIADSNKELCMALSKFLNGMSDVDVVGWSCDGQETLEKCQGADVLVTDLILPQLDGLAVIENISHWPESERPDIIVMTSLTSEDVIAKVCRFGIKNYMMKPFSVDSLYRQISEQVVPLKDRTTVYAVPEVIETKSIEEKITSVFLSIGIPAHIKGYGFLRTAIKLSIDNERLLSGITKELYPMVAEISNTTASKVERAIRHAIEVAWTRGRIENINKMFGYIVYTKNDKPTNGEFIALIADRLRLELKNTSGDPDNDKSKTPA